VKVNVPTPYPVDRPVPYPVQVAVKVPVVQQVPVEVSRPYPVLVQQPASVVVQQQPVLWQKVSSSYPVYTTGQQPVQWQKQPSYYSSVDNSKNYIGMPVYNGGNQAGYQRGQYPSGYSIGVNHALIGLGVGGRGAGATGTSGPTGIIGGAAGSLLGAAFNVMQGLMSPGGSVTGYAAGHNDYLGPKTTGFSTVINK